MCLLIGIKFLIAHWCIVPPQLVRRHLINEVRPARCSMKLFILSNQYVHEVSWSSFSSSTRSWHWTMLSMKENLKMMKTTSFSSIFQQTTNNSWIEINSSSHGKTGNHFLLALRPQKPIQDRVEWLLFPGAPLVDLTVLLVATTSIWLLLLTILKHDGVRQWEGLSHILWKIKNVWNHQPVYITHDIVNITHQLPCEKHTFLWR